MHGTTLVAGLNVQVDASGRMRNIDYLMLSPYLDVLPGPELMASYPRGLNKERIRAGGDVESEHPFTTSRLLGLTVAFRVLFFPARVGIVLRQLSKSSQAYIRLPSYDGLLAAALSRFLRKPYILSLHGDWLAVCQGSADKSLSALRLARCRLLSHQLAKALSAASHVIFIGEALAERYGASVSTSLTAANWLHSRRSLLEPISDERHSKRRVVYVGGVGERKGVQCLIAAARQARRSLPDLTLVIAGSGPDLEGFRSRRDDAEEHWLEFSGWIESRESLHALIASASVLVVPSLYGEGVPKVLFEAMVAGTPIIGSDAPGIGDTLTRASAGLVVARDSEDELEASLLRYFNDYDLAHRLAIAGSKYARANSIETLIERLNELFRRADVGD